VIRTSVKIFLCFFLLSCQDKIELGVPAGIDDSISVQGKLIKGNPSVVQVSIERIFVFDASNRLVLVDNMSIEDTEGNLKLLEKKDLINYAVDIPENDSEINVEFNKAYRININLADGTALQSEYATLLPLNKSDNQISLQRSSRTFENDEGETVTRDFFDVNLRSVIPLDLDTKYRWEVQRTFKFTDRGDESRIGSIDSRVKQTCYVTDDIELKNILIYDPQASNVTSDVYDQNLFQNDIDFRYTEGLYLTVFQESIEDSAYDYFDKISSLINRTGNMFEPPAGKIQSNITNLTDDSREIFGYFYATEQDTLRQYISGEEAGQFESICFRPVPPTFGGCQFALGACCSCLVFENSTIKKPNYWIED